MVAQGNQEGSLSKQIAGKHKYKVMFLLMAGDCFIGEHVLGQAKW